MIEEHEIPMELTAPGAPPVPQMGHFASQSCPCGPKPRQVWPMGNAWNGAPQPFVRWEHRPLTPEGIPA